MKLFVKDKSAVKVTFHSKTSTKYDGHCLRAFSYFPEDLPLIHMAEPTERCFKVVMKDGSTLYISDSEPVKINGNYYSSFREYRERYEQGNSC